MMALFIIVSKGVASIPIFLKLLGVVRDGLFFFQEASLVAFHGSFSVSTIFVYSISSLNKFHILLSAMPLL